MTLLLAALALAATLPDRGIYPEFDSLATLTVPPGTSAARTWLRVDPTHQMLTLYDGSDPLTVYPVDVPAHLAATTVGALHLHAGEGPGVAMQGADLAELRRFVEDTNFSVVGPPPRSDDRDDDGIVDRLDIARGARKLLENKARYIERYVSMRYPAGDVPRTEGVCTDTVIRSLRNAGIDLQKEVHEDVLRAPDAYPMVEKVDASINHRRVRTVVRWFERHFKSLPAGTPYLPGDVVFFDTFPSKPGPDHLGIVSDRTSDKGVPFVINNWTDGTVDREMELLSWVPVTHHFRAPSTTKAPPVSIAK